MTNTKLLTLLLVVYIDLSQSTEFYFECLEDRADFKTAQALCVARGRTLVTIRNEHEELALRTLLRTEECAGEVDWKWRHAWLNYQGGQWLDGFPMIHSSWPDDTPSAMCVKFAVKGWIVRKCETKAATMLLCEDRRDEDEGKYRILLRKTSTMESIPLIPGSNGISASFFVPSTAIVTVEIFENEITIYLLNLRNEDTNEYEERRLVASSAENTTLTKVSTGEVTTYPSISTESEYLIFFVAHSDCSLYDVNIFDTRDGNTGPAINWNNNNWYIQGPYQYFSPPKTNDHAAISACKEGTFWDTTKDHPKCSYCPAGQYQNLKTTNFCKPCPPRFDGIIVGQTFCSCDVGQCGFEEDSTDEPSYVHQEPAENIATPKGTTPVKTDAKVTTNNSTTLAPTLKVETTESPSTIASDQSGTSKPVDYIVEPKTCFSEGSKNELYGNFNWSDTEAGEVALSRCVYNISETTVYAKRRCLSNDKQAFWEEPDYSQCATEKDLKILSITSIEITEENAVEVAGNLKEMTNSMEEVSSSGVEATVSALEELENHIKPENGQVYADISSNLLDVSEDKLSNSKSSLQNLMTKIAASISKSDTDQKIFTKNVDILTAKLDPNKDALISTNNTSIDIPKYLTSRTNGAYVVVYKTPKLFKPVDDNDKITVISDLHFSGLKVENSETDIRLNFKELQTWKENETHSIKCVFWNETAWDDYGCRYDSKEKACFCNHATPFTSILSFKSQVIEEPVNPVVWWIEVICFSVSIISCIIFITIILSIRGLRRLQSFKMHCNLAVALCLQYTGLLILDVTELEGVKCKAIGFLVHWITLACFFAMFAEALSVYLAIVVVFDTHVSHIVVKVALFCWGTTGCFVSLFAGITKMKHYSCTAHGYLDSPYNQYFLNIPVLAILLINLMMFTRVIWNTFKNKDTRRRDSSRKAQVISQLKMVFSLNSMLGIGYLIGLVSDFSFACKIIFILINGLTGLFLLCLFGIFNPMTKAAVKKSLRRHQAVTETKSTYAYKLTATAEAKDNTF